MHGHMSNMVTCQTWSHVKHGHMSGLKGVSAPLSHVKHGHMSNMVTCQTWSHVKHGHMSNVTGLKGGFGPLVGVKGGFGPLVGVKGGLRPPCRVTECAEWYLSL